MLRCTVNDFLLALGEPAPETPLVDDLWTTHVCQAVGDELGTKERIPGTFDAEVKRSWNK